MEAAAVRSTGRWQPVSSQIALQSKNFQSRSSHLRLSKRRVPRALSGEVAGYKSSWQQRQQQMELSELTFWERLQLAWRVLFPPPKRSALSNAEIAKQRLKMILVSDRCAVSNEAKQQIVSSIVTALSEFVEIESEDKVELNVSSDPELGTVYSVSVPVRRVKPEYQNV